VVVCLSAGSYRGWSNGYLSLCAGWYSNHVYSKYLPLRGVESGVDGALITACG
jgi:hypothetical protein